MARLGLKLREQVRKDGAANTYLALREGVAEGKVNLKRDFSLLEMAQSFLGDDWADDLKRWAHVNMGRESVALREGSAEAVDASAFAAITGQLLVDTIREKYEHATKVGNDIFSTVQISNGNLSTQREPGLSRVKHDVGNVNQGMPYPATQFDQNYVDYPAPSKFGEICNVTFEMIFSDLTTQAVESAESVGEMTGLEEEYRKLRVFLGAVNNHSWLGTAFNTYLTAGSWINSLTDFELTDWHAVNRVEQLFAEMLDPFTGKPIQIDAKDLFVMPYNAMQARRILTATEVRDQQVPASAAVNTISANPITQTYNPIVSKHAYQIAQAPTAGNLGLGLTAAKARTLTVWGDFKRAFVWRQVFPVKVVQAPPMNPWEFLQDIVLSVKASGYGVAGIRDPRYVARAYNAAA